MTISQIYNERTDFNDLGHIRVDVPAYEFISKKKKIVKNFKFQILIFIAKF